MIDIKGEAIQAYEEYVKDMVQINDSLVRELAKSFFIGGYMSGQHHLLQNFIKENTSERSEPGTTAL